MLSNAYFVAKFRFDTAENEPAKNSQNFRKMHFRKCIFEKCIFRKCIFRKCIFLLPVMVIGRATVLTQALAAGRQRPAEAEGAPPARVVPGAGLRPARSQSFAKFCNFLVGSFFAVFAAFAFCSILQHLSSSTRFAHF